jgi:hypothetical protein
MVGNSYLTGLLQGSPSVDNNPDQERTSISELSENDRRISSLASFRCVCFSRVEEQRLLQNVSNCRQDGLGAPGLSVWSSEVF